MKKKAGKGFLDWWLAEKRECIFLARGIAKNVRVLSSKEKWDRKRISLKLKCRWFLSKEIILGHPCIPCAGLTRVAIRSNPDNKGRSWGGGGGGRYEAQRVKGEFYVITCNLTALAPHLLVSVVPRIWIAVSKSPFLIELKSICIVIPFHPAHI